MFNVMGSDVASGPQSIFHRLKLDYLRIFNKYFHSNCSGEVFFPFTRHRYDFKHRAILPAENVSSRDFSDLKLSSDFLFFCQLSS